MHNSIDSKSVYWTLIVRNVDEAIINALKQRAVEHHRSKEAAHRAILAEILNVISEIGKGEKVNAGVDQYFSVAITHHNRLYISAITIGELRRGVDLIFHRGDSIQGKQLENWLTSI